MSVILSPPLPASLSLTSCVGGERLTPLGPAVDVTSFTKTNPLNQGHNMAHKSAAARESPHGTKRKLEPTALAIEPVPCKPVTSSTTKPAASPKPSSSSSAKIPALQLQLVSAATLSPTAANGPSTAGRVSPTASTETAAGDAQPSSSAKVKKPSRKEADNHVRTAYKCNKCGMPKKGHVCPLSIATTGIASSSFAPTRAVSPTPDSPKQPGSPSSGLTSSPAERSETQSNLMVSNFYTNMFSLAITNLETLRNALQKPLPNGVKWARLGSAIQRLSDEIHALKRDQTELSICFRQAAGTTTTTTTPSSTPAPTTDANTDDDDNDTPQTRSGKRRRSSAPDEEEDAIRILNAVAGEEAPLPSVPLIPVPIKRASSSSSLKDVPSLVRGRSKEDSPPLFPAGSSGDFAIPSSQEDLFPSSPSSPFKLVRGRTRAASSQEQFLQPITSSQEELVQSLMQQHKTWKESSGSQLSELEPPDMTNTPDIGD